MPTTCVWYDWRDTNSYVHSFPWQNPGIRGNLQELFVDNHMNLHTEEVSCVKLDIQLKA